MNSDWIADFRYSLRKLAKARAFVAIAVLSLGLGIGANTAIFTLVDRVLLRMLPVQAPEELRLVSSGTREQPRVYWNYPDYAAFRDQVKAFRGLIAFGGGGNSGFRYESEAGEIAQGIMVSGNYFETLGVKPRIGR